MKLILPLLATLTLASPPLALAAQQLDPSRSEIRFTARQMGVSAEGRFRKFAAQVDFHPDRLAQSRATIDIDIASISLGSPENETELKKRAWFNLAGFPTARFTAHRFVQRSGNQYQVDGKLTIKGISRDVSAPFTLQQSGTTLTVSGTVPLKRLQFNIGEGEWADTETVADDVQVSFRLGLITSPTAPR